MIHLQHNSTSLPSLFLASTFDIHHTTAFLTLLGLVNGNYRARIRPLPNKPALLTSHLSASMASQPEALSCMYPDDRIELMDDPLSPSR
jgi:hypothetical protein